MRMPERDRRSPSGGVTCTITRSKRTVIGCFGWPGRRGRAVEPAPFDGPAVEVRSLVVAVSSCSPDTTAAPYRKTSRAHPRGHTCRGCIRARHDPDGEVGAEARDNPRARRPEAWGGFEGASSRGDSRACRTLVDLLHFGRPHATGERPRRTGA